MDWFKSKQVTKKECSKIPSLAKQYKMMLLIAVSGICMFMISSFFVESQYDYPESQIGDQASVSNGVSIELLNERWNSESGLMRIDFAFRTSSATDKVKLNNLEIEEVIARYIGDEADTLDNHYIQVNDHYVVVYIEHLPENFKVFGVGMRPKFVNPEIEQFAENIGENTLQFYFYEKNISVDHDLVMQSQSELQLDWLSHRQNELEQKIDENKEALRVSRIRINNLTQTLSSLNDADTAFMTKEEIDDLAKEKQEIEIAYKAEQEEVNRLSDEIEEWEERIQLFEDEKTSLQVKIDWSD